MTKSLKIFLSVLALISISLSISILFDLDPFVKKERQVFTEEDLIQPPSIPKELVDIKPVVLERNHIFSLPVEEKYFNNPYFLDGTALGKEKVFLAFFLDPGVEIKAVFKGSVLNITEFKHNGIHSFSYEPDFTQILIEEENEDFKANYMFIGEVLVEKDDIFEKGTVLAKAEKGTLYSRGGANLSLSITIGNDTPVELSKDLFGLAK
jgi:hypothetical protein